MKDGRAWAALDVGYFDNPKVIDVLDASSTAVSMHVASVLHCAQHLTDGHVSPKLILRKVGGSESDVELLMDAGLWHGPDHGCPDCPEPHAGRVYVHDFLKHNRSKEDAEAKSNQARRAALKRHNKPISADRMQTASDEHAERNAPTYLPTNKPAPSRRSPETPIPDDWAPTQAHAQKAREKGVDLDREAETFRLHAQTNDRRVRRWDQAFSMWLTKAKADPQAQQAAPDFSAWNDYRPDYDEDIA